MKRKSQPGDQTSLEPKRRKRHKERHHQLPKRASAIKANSIISQQLFVPQLEGDDLPELDLSLVRKQLMNSSTSHYDNHTDDHNDNSDEDKKPTERRRTLSKLQKLNRTANRKSNDNRISSSDSGSTIESLVVMDQSLIELFKQIEREYEEKIKILNEKCFLLEYRLNHFNQYDDNDDGDENDHHVEIGGHDHHHIELEPIYEFGGLSPPSSPVLISLPPMIELTPPTPSSPTLTLSQVSDDFEKGEEIQSLSQETNIEDHDIMHGVDDAIVNTPQKRRVGVLLEDPMEMHINSSPSLSDTSSDIDFAWLFEQHLMPPPSTPGHAVSTPSSSTSTSVSDVSDHNSCSSGGRRSTRRGEKKQKIESILNRLRTEMSVSVLLPNLIFNEYVNNELTRSGSLSEKTPPRNRSVEKRASLSSEHIYTDRKLKLKDKSYVRTNYSYRGIELPENLIFFCKL